MNGIVQITLARVREGFKLVYWENVKVRAYYTIFVECEDLPPDQIFNFRQATKEVHLKSIIILRALLASHNVLKINTNISQVDKTTKFMRIKKNFLLEPTSYS